MPPMGDTYPAYVHIFGFSRMGLLGRVSIMIMSPCCSPVPAGMPYLDIIRDAKERARVPVAVYQVRQCLKYCFTCAE